MVRVDFFRLSSFSLGKWVQNNKVVLLFKMDGGIPGSIVSKLLVSFFDEASIDPEADEHFVKVDLHSDYSGCCCSELL
jgi:hypothetical protein